jgi:predicted AAA+ superfamily ATPase
MNASPKLYPRLIATHVAEALGDTPVVLIAGPRQAGKTTLACQIATRHPDQLPRFLRALA